MTTLLATAIGAAAAQILASAKTANVNGITSRGIFCATSYGQVVFLSYEAWRGPLTINLVPIHPPGVEPIPSQADFHLSMAPLDQVALGSQAELQPGQLQFSGIDLRIYCGQQRPWLYVCANPSKPDLLEIRQRVKQVAYRLLERSARKGWSDYLSAWTTGQDRKSVV